jgi:hypothetical protein
MITFSNPRLSATFSDWPLGGNKRGECKFWIETHPKRGHRFVRQTTGKPKTATYGGRGAIVDGSDGRTYLIQYAGAFVGFIKVWCHDFMCPLPEVHPSSVFVDTQPELYETLKGLIEGTPDEKAKAS